MSIIASTITLYCHLLLLVLVSFIVNELCWLFQLPRRLLLILLSIIFLLMLVVHKTCVLRCI